MQFCSADRLSIRKRKQIFRDLVSIQDRGMAAPASRRHVIAAWAITMPTLDSIELQGISGDPSWLEVYDEQLAADGRQEEEVESAKVAVAEPLDVSAITE